MYIIYNCIIIYATLNICIIENNNDHITVSICGSSATCLQVCVGDVGASRVKGGSCSQT